MEALTKVPDLPEKRTIRILAIDGGQIPGIIPVTILERMEGILRHECGEKACLADCFDLMVGTSEGALTLLLLNAIDPGNSSCLYSARKIYELYRDGKLPERNKNTLRQKADSFFSQRWLSESLSRLYLPVCNVGQQHPWIFDSEEANLPSQDFKMSDVAYVGMLDFSDAEVIENKEGDPDYKLCHAEAIYGDVAFEGLQKAIRLFPRHNFFIASLGVGEMPRAYGFHGVSNFDTLSAHIHQDCHLNHFYELKRLIEVELSGKVDYIRIQLPLDLPTIQDPAALRQAGLSVANSQNPQDYPAFKTISEELRKAYKERFCQITSQETPFKRVHHLRLWKPVTNKIFPFYLPDPSEEKFIESAEEEADKSYLIMLWESLHQTGITTLSAKAAVAGMGGVGKSSLALKYAYEACENYAYNMIYWFPSETELQLCEGYRNLLQDLQVPLKGDERVDQLLRLINNNISNKDLFFLLVYDNVPDPNFLHNKTPQKGGHVLITSRCSERWGNNTILLNVFRPQDSIQYFLNVTGVEPSDENEIKAGELAKELGHLPLALSHAAGYIRYVGGNAVSGKHFDEYLEAFRKEPSNHFEEYKDPFSDCQPEISHEHLIAKTWGMAGKIISPLAQELMTYFSYLTPDFIPEDIFLEYCGSEKALQEVLAQLRSFSLIKRDQEKRLLTVHRLVQLVIKAKKDCVNSEEQNRYIEYLISAINHHLPTCPSLLIPHLVQFPYFIPHAEKLLESEENVNVIPYEKLRLHMSMFEFYLTNRLDRERADYHLKKIEIMGDNEIKKMENKYICQYYINKANLYKHKSDYDNAIFNGLQALNHTKNINSELTDNNEKEEYVRVINNISQYYIATGKLKEASQYLNRIAIFFSNQQQETFIWSRYRAVFYYTCAWISMDRGEFQNAEEAIEKAIQIMREDKFSQQIFSVLTMKAEILFKENKFELAHNTACEAYNMHTEFQGTSPGIPKKSEIIKIVTSQSLLADKCNFMNEIIENYNTHYGRTSSHPTLALAYKILGDLYSEQEKLNEAETNYKKTEIIYDSYKEKTIYDIGILYYQLFILYQKLNNSFQEIIYLNKYREFFNESGYNVPYKI